MRRTTARGSDGEWVVITLWASAEHADAAASTLDELRSFVDAATVRSARYTPLD